ncbi:ribosomal large subunit pseudouridine synthase A [Sideroxyarcus emersonii]|uniref:Ribosomal large subunit pseudouridine synthase A n=1 Tax=Sideroxyarcus emersonii TaxID=2764705 RepID=A0AAN1XCM1_9PROT|nr:RluA family pseudouridine synthase [Sideroxyarcus emersonii]BCK88903.1 ribosomal large subunit pseudouridine synthase A [Sideroxyarcus emersonii]
MTGLAIPPGNSAPDLLYSDESLLVAVKPAGLLAVPGRGADKQDCLSLRLQQEFPDVLVVHRLDMATSGLLVFARGVSMQRRLSNMFRDREVDKRYVAVVAGRLEPAAGEVDLPIAADWPNRPLRKIDAVAGKPSLTRYRSLSHGVDCTRVELEPVTGRTHQLRIHMAAIGHPILGDALYGDSASAPRLLLHACSLGFAHPLSGAPLNFSHPPPF